VLLQIVPDARYIGRDLEALVRRTLATFRRAEFGFLGVVCTPGCTTPRFLGASFHGGRLGLLPHRFTALPHELIDCRHISPVGSARPPGWPTPRSIGPKL